MYDFALSEQLKAEGWAEDKITNLMNLLKPSSSGTQTTTVNAPAPSVASQMIGGAATIAGTLGTIANAKGGVIKQRKSGLDTLGMYNAMKGGRA